MPTLTFVLAIACQQVPACAGMLEDPPERALVTEWVELYRTRTDVRIAWATRVQQVEDPKRKEYRCYYDETKLRGLRGSMRTTRTFMSRELFKEDEIAFRVEQLWFESDKKASLSGMDVQGRLANANDGWTHLTPLPHPEWYEQMQPGSAAQYPGVLAVWLSSDPKHLQLAKIVSRESGGVRVTLQDSPFAFEIVRDPSFGPVLTQLDSYDFTDRTQLSASIRFASFTKQYPVFGAVPTRRETWTPRFSGKLNGDSGPVKMEGPPVLGSVAHLVLIMAIDKASDDEFDVRAITGLRDVDDTGPDDAAPIAERPPTKASTPPANVGNFLQRNSILGVAAGVALLLAAVVLWWKRGRHA